MKITPERLSRYTFRSFTSRVLVAKISMLSSLTAPMSISKVLKCFIDALWGDGGARFLSRELEPLRARRQRFFKQPKNVVHLGRYFTRFSCSQGDDSALRSLPFIEEADKKTLFRK